MRLNHWAMQRPMLIFVLGVLLALAVAITVAGPMLDAPPHDVMLLLEYLAFTGFLTIVASYILYRLGLANWFRSLRWALLAVIGLTVALIFLNVWVTARLMFLQQHDLRLTGLLLI